MGAVAAAPAFDGLAFAFAALAFALVAYALIINPMRSGADAASGLPVVGGAVAWALSNLANLVESAVYYVDSLKYAAYRDAASWWNWIVTNTIGAYYGDINGNFASISGNINALWSQTFGAIPLAISGLQASVSALWSTVNGLAEWQRAVSAQTIPDIYSWIDRLNRLTVAMGNDLAIIDSQTLPAIHASITYLRSVANGMVAWQENADAVVLPRIRADVGARAFESEAEWLRDQLGQALRNIDLLLPLAVVAIAGAVAIENLRCQMDVPCDPLSALAQGDVIDRLNSLEIGEA